MKKDIEFEAIEDKHKKIIEIAIKYMSTVQDKEHDINHMNDVVYYTKEILNNLDESFDASACIIAAYWHDVGRTKISKGHEELSAEMLKEQMQEMNYERDFIEKCYNAIKFHKWNMKPTTIEGLIVKDADKIAWLGLGRWKSCIENNQRLDELMNLLPKLKNEILYFDYSKTLYDKEILKLMKMLYDKIYDEMKR